MNGVSSNEAKHTTGNPVVRALLERFHAAVTGEVRALSPSALLDVGCGEGFVLSHLGPLGEGSVVRGIDLSAQAVARCRENAPWVDAQVGSALDLPFADKTFDVVICLEVLEHLERPVDALRELTRVCRGSLVLSVPWEPWFQLGNLARGNHLSGFGNHPEHIQRWTQGGFRRMLEGSGVVQDVRVRGAFPWTVAVARPV